MKEMIKVFSVFVSMIMVVSCATTPGPLPEKYNLDNELEEVNQIYTLTVSSWEEVDIQSVILRAHLSDYYLLVLDRPMESRITDLTIGISSTVMYRLPAEMAGTFKAAPGTVQPMYSPEFSAYSSGRTIDITAAGQGE
jgi:hypothetical protein